MSEREEFEKWVEETEGAPPSPNFFDDMMYMVGVHQQWQARAALSQPASKIGPIERDEAMDRSYIPVHPNWEIQTKGKGSSFRIAEKVGDEWHRYLVADTYLHAPLEAMARAIHAAQPAPASDEVLRLRNQVETAKRIVNAGIDLMTLKQVGRWTGVRTFLEAETDMYEPQPAPASEQLDAFIARQKPTPPEIQKVINNKMPELLYEAKASEPAEPNNAKVRGEE